MDQFDSIVRIISRLGPTQAVQPAQTSCEPSVRLDGLTHSLETQPVTN